MSNYSGPSPARTAATAEVIDLYTKQQLHMQEIAGRVGLSYGTVRNILVEASVELRPRGGRRKR